MKKRNFTDVGYLSIDNGKIDVTDPCYDRDVWCRVNDVEVVPGKYVCQIEKQNDGIFGRGVSAIRIALCNSDFSKSNPERLEWFDSIGVDAGLAGFFVSPKKDYTDSEWSDLCHWMYDNAKASEWNSDKDNDFYITDAGFFSSSGYGDGEYDVYVEKSEGKIVAVEIRFI